jgi:hypothetical protein
VFPTHCRDGCVPPCEIARCCRDKGHVTCAECADSQGCDRFTERHAQAKQNLEAIRTRGLEVWAHEQYAEVVADWRDRLLGAVGEALSR